jgi:dTDP-4-amino-4,6-dideoxy-D-galactose acyltransferase
LKSNDLNDYWISKINRINSNKKSFFHEYTSSDGTAIFMVDYLDWDSNYFGISCYKIEPILHNFSERGSLHAAILSLCSVLNKMEESYFFTDIPSEDIEVIKSLHHTPFRLVETRLNYILSHLDFPEDPVYPCRQANFSDINKLYNVSKLCKNPYDRVHADDTFSDEQADEYLGIFVKNSVEGFADYVLVPDLEGIEPFGFLAGNKPVSVGQSKVAKLVLAACDSSVQRGWMYKLTVEMARRVKEDGATHLTTITQSANIPAIRTWEKSGFDYGFCSHIFSFNTKR